MIKRAHMKHAFRIDEVAQLTRGSTPLIQNRKRGRVRYCRLLEEGPYFRGRSADFLTMVLFGAMLMLIIAPFSSVFFLGSSLTFMMVYVWGR